MTSHYLAEGVALVVASAVIAYVCNRLKILPIVGFLLAGVAIGPNALGIVRDAELIDVVAEVGVILLLFTLGIEFSLERLARIKRFIFAGGALQMALTIAAAALLLQFAGTGWKTGIFTGSLVALSSTALVMKILESSNETTTMRGQLALGILIFQDLALVGLVLLMPMLAGDVVSPLAIVRELALAMTIVIAAVAIARRIMPGILDRVAKTCSQEIFLLTIIAICLGTAFLTNLAGVSLSLGAFLAGLVVSESRYSHHAFAEILPLQILFSAVFFVSVGLLLDLGFVFEHAPLILGVVVAVLILKIITTSVSALVLRVPVATAIGTAFLLAQIGEFSFVLERVGRGAGLHPAGVAGMGGQTFIAAAVLLMVVTPLLARVAKSIEQRGAMEAIPVEDPVADVTSIDIRDHVIVAGYGSAARYLTRVLRDSGIPFVIVTLSPTGAAEAEGEKLPVLVGDYSRRVILDRAGIEHARVLVIPDDTRETAQRVASVARVVNPTIHIVVRTERNDDVDALLQNGADEVLVDELEIGIQLFTHILGDYDAGLEQIHHQVAAVRAGGYRMLRDDDSRTITLTEEQQQACDHARQVRSKVTSSAAGCEECLRIGDTWVHLRICMSCGAVRCCDSSKNRHATRHNAESGHPVIRSYQPGEAWAWCYPDRLSF